MAFENRPHASRMDKLCALLLVISFLIPHFVVWAMDTAAYKAAEAAQADKLQAVTITDSNIGPTTFARPVESIKEARREAQREARREVLYWQNVPLDLECQTALKEACEVNGVPVSLALGLIEVESNFDPEADNGVSRGLMQLNKRYFSSDLTPAENIQAGVAHLGGLMKKYGDTQAALCAYNVGHDTGARGYAKAVLAASEKYGKG